MRNPFRSEGDAFRAAIVCAVIAGISILVGVLAGAVYGYALLGAGAAAALLFAALVGAPDRLRPLREAAEAPHPSAPKARHRVLVVANEALTGPELRRELLRRVELWPELIVVAPVLSSRLHFWASDFDRELQEARGRLESTLAWAREQGLEAIGEVGDPDPVTAIEDALRRFGADEIVVATHPPGRVSWLESGVLERLREQLDVPLTHVVVDLAHERLEIEPAPSRAAT